MIDGMIFKKVSVFILLGILAVLSIFVIWPIAPSIIIGLLLAYIFYPIYRRIFSATKRRNLSALIIILAVFIVLFLPLWVILPVVAKRVFDIFLHLQKVDFFIVLKDLFPNLANIEFSKEFAMSFNQFIADIAGKIISAISSFIIDIPRFMLKAVIVLVVFFFTLRDAEIFANYAKSLSPFSKTIEEHIINQFKNITSSIVYGQVVIGAITGILTGIGLFIFRVPQALLLAIMAIFAAIIPIIGAWIIWVPAVIYLFMLGHTVLAIGLLIYGAVFITWVDNIIRPYVIARRTQVSTVIILVGMIGGLIVFGILGLIIGPLILSYLFLILDAYRKNRFPSLFLQEP